MSMDLFAAWLGWMALVNYGVLLLWFVVFAFARDDLRHLHGRWFRLSDTAFDAIHYGAMAGYKLLIFVFCLVPWITLVVLRA